MRQQEHVRGQASNSNECGERVLKRTGELLKRGACSRGIGVWRGCRGLWSWAKNCNLHPSLCRPHTSKHTLTLSADKQLQSLLLLSQAQ